MSESPGQLLDQVEKTAYKYLTEGRTHGCSVTVLLTLQEAMGQVNESLIKACGPFAGGSKQGLLCGALIGGLLIIGTKYGQGLDEISDINKLEESFEYVKKLYGPFKEKYGSWFCHEIIGFDLTNPKEREEYFNSGGKEKCARICGWAARKAAEIVFNR
ncbi:MAG: C-GCAxxG-C-C family protein [Peptococcaceae bacterium]|nr:C-GCAxxG-C-C family protein [Peptococcaceae bacterium]